MKVSRHTKAIVENVKDEALAIAHQLEILHARLNEHAGTKRISSQLQRVIDQLKEWQRSV